MIEFKYEYEGHKVSITCPEEGTCDEVLESFKSFMLAVGYHPDSIKDMLNDYEE